MPIENAVHFSTGFAVGNAPCIVRSNRQINDRYWHLVLDAPAPLYYAVPGQFFHLLCPPGIGNEPYLRRPMSVYRVSAEERVIEFLYNVVGMGTRALSRVKPGDVMSALGPLGVGFTLKPTFKHILMVARGVGLATMAAVVPWARRRKIAVTAILSARSPWDLMEREFTQHEQIAVHPVFDQDGSSSVDRVEALLENIIEASRPDITFTCGSNRLMQVMQKIGRKHGIPGEIALEQQMACALGVCLSCVRPIQVGNETVHKRVCCEGPVFDVQQVRGTWVHG
jgi:dihydroorotate dehydrogenase electron transfer subunit